MAKEVISRCDKCGTSEDVQEVTITVMGETKTVDLCLKDAGPVIEAFQLGEPAGKAPAPRRRPGRPSSHAVVPIEDWDGQPSK